jgi:hypothetical protein
MPRILTLLQSLVISIVTFSQIDSVRYSPVQNRYEFDWGGKKSSLVLTQYGDRKGLVMIHLHDDELTAMDAAKKIMSQTGGLLIQLENGGERLVTFKKGGRKFQFDPNRIFTAAGRYHNLHFLNDTVTPAAASSVKAFASFILQKIPKHVFTLVAIHNNENGKYSVNSYKDGSHAKDVLRWYTSHNNDPDNFFIVNNNEMFKQIKRLGFNVVLQNSLKARDDGSLSIYYGKKNLVYINVETQKGDLEEQVKMLRALFNILD